MRNSISRRTILRGIGSALSLPMLEAMFPVQSAFGMTAPKAPNRMAFVFFPNGAIPAKWNPQGGQGALQLSPTLEPLSNHRSSINVISGLTQHHGRANGDGAGDHARNVSSFLTGAQPRKTNGADIKVGTSIDQAAAKLIGSQTRLPSLELGIKRGRNAGSCDSGYSCVYSSNISWKSASTPAPKEINPKLAFERLFGSPEDKENAKRRSQYRASILDLVADDAKKLRSQLGQTDKRKVDEYFNSVREVEQRIERNSNEVVDIPDYDLPPDIPGEYSKHCEVMFDILALAFETDSTRIATFMLGNAGSNRTYPDVGVKDGHHHISHHGKDKKKIAKLEKIDKYLVTRFAYLVEKLASTKEGDKNLLHNSVVLYGSAIGDSDRHRHHDLPVVLAGNGGGTIKTGRHLVFPKETPMNNLFLSMSDLVGAKMDRIGDSKGRLPIS